MFGPPVGRYFIFFIDDLNMPMLEQYGAQPPIELLRQWMDHQGWYDRKQIGMTQILCPELSAKAGLLHTCTSRGYWQRGFLARAQHSFLILHSPRHFQEGGRY